MAMNTNFWCMYKVNDMSEQAVWLRTKHPNAVSHDGVNSLFVSIPENTEGMFTLPQTDIDTMVMTAAAFLYKETAGMLLTKAQAETLFRHPAHRLWCARYEEDQMDLFESDYNDNRDYAVAMGSTSWPEFSEDLTPLEARAIMLETLAA